MLANQLIHTRPIFFFSFFSLLIFLYYPFFSPSPPFLLHLFACLFFPFAPYHSFVSEKKFFSVSWKIFAHRYSFGFLCIDTNTEYIAFFHSLPPTNLSFAILTMCPNLFLLACHPFHYSSFPSDLSLGSHSFHLITASFPTWLVNFLFILSSMFFPLPIVPAIQLYFLRANEYFFQLQVVRVLEFNRNVFIYSKT